MSILQQSTKKVIYRVILDIPKHFASKIQDNRSSSLHTWLSADTFELSLPKNLGLKICSKNIEKCHKFFLSIIEQLTGKFLKNWRINCWLILNPDTNMVSGLIDCAWYQLKTIFIVQIVIVCYDMQTKCFIDDCSDPEQLFL